MNAQTQQRPKALLFLIAALLLLPSGTAFSQVHISYAGEQSYRYAVIKNTTNEKIIATIRYSGRKMPIATDGQEVSGTETIVLGPGASETYGGHSVAITSASLVSAKVDKSDEIRRNIAQIEQQIEALESNANVETVKRRKESGILLRQRIQNDEDLTSSDRQQLIAKLDQKMRELDSLINDHDRKKAALLSELQSLRNQLQ